MAKLLSATAVLFLLAFTASLQAAEPAAQAALEPKMRCAPDTPLDADTAVVVSEAKATRKPRHRDLIQVADKGPLTTVLYEECDNWACWQNPDPPLCACEGFWCGPIFICGTPCGPGGC